MVTAAQVRIYLYWIITILTVLFSRSFITVQHSATPINCPKMASKPVATDPPTITVEEIIREFYIEMKKELNLKVIADVLYARGLIDHGLKQTIDREVMTQAAANGLFLDHLIGNGTLDTLRMFCEVLKTAESHLLPHHRDWSNKLKQKLTKVSRHKLNSINYSVF